MSTSSRAALKFSRFISNTSSGYRNLASYNNCTLQPLHEINAFALSKSATPTKALSEKTDLILEGIFARSFPLPHANQMASVEPIEVNNFSCSNGLAVSFLDPIEQNGAIEVMNRNARGPKKANKRSRPCSRVARRKKKDAVGKRRR